MLDKVQVFGKYVIHNAMSVWDACILWEDAAQNGETEADLCHLMTLVIEMNRR